MGNIKERQNKEVVTDISTSDIVVQLLIEMGIPSNRISKYGNHARCTINIDNSSTIKEILLEHHDDITMPIGIRMHVQGVSVKIFGVRGNRLSICDPEFEKKFKDEITKLMKKRIDFRTIVKVKEILEDFLEDFSKFNWEGN
jgi:hypothetical protein